jgi:hypothetical protein
MTQRGRWVRSIAKTIPPVTLVGAVIFGGMAAAGEVAQAAAPTSSHPEGNAAPSSRPQWGKGTVLGVNPDYNHPVPGQSQTAHISGQQATDTVSGNWAGLVESGATSYTSVSATWTVPTVQATPRGVSSTWIGIDGYTNHDLIQTGTEQDSFEGFPDYYSWYELLPDSEVEIGQVNPGDEMNAEIFKNPSPAPPNMWTIDISDLSVPGDNFSQQFSYDTPETSAEWIEELTNVTPTQPPLANFGTATFTDLNFTDADPSGNVPTLITMENSHDVIAYPTGSDSTQLTAHYGQPASQTSITASPSSVKLGNSVTYSASVTTGVEGMPTPSGSVSFSAGSKVLCTATLSNGSGACSAATAPAGTDTISGTYSGSSVFSGSTGSTTVVVNGPLGHGYWLVGSDGGIFTFGAAQFYGSTGSLRLQRPVVGIVPTGDEGGYWLDASDGGVFSYGDTQFDGSIPGLGINPSGSGLPHSLDAPIVGMVPSADDGGYFMVGSDGGVFAFGDAKFAGSCPGIGGCSGAAVAVMPDATGNGYWVVTATGHVYTFGDAPYFGAPGPQSVPVTSAARSPNGNGYMILFANGAVSSYGQTAFAGCPQGAPYGGLNPATALFVTADGGGYWVATANGTVVNCGGAPNDGGMAGARLNGSIIAATGW